jgi:hypothetical protein
VGGLSAGTAASVNAALPPTPDPESELRSPRTPPRAMRVEGGEFSIANGSRQCALDDRLRDASRRMKRLKWKLLQLLKMPARSLKRSSGCGARTFGVCAASGDTDAALATEVSDEALPHNS